MILASKRHGRLVLAVASLLAIVAGASADVLTRHELHTFRRYGAGAIFDPGRQRMIVSGGVGDGSGPHTQILDLAGPPNWTRPAIQGASPPATAFDAAVFDSLRDRMLFFSPGPGSGVWSLSLAEPLTWTQLSPAGTKPSLVGAHLIYDSARDRIVGYGGFADQTPTSAALSSSWTLSLGATPAWSSLAAGGAPPTRAQGAAIYDPVLDRMIVFGGSTRVNGFTDDRNDTWQLSFAGGLPTWNPVTTTGTPPSEAHAGHAWAAVFDRARHRLVVSHGAREDFAALQGSQVWTLDLDTHEWLAFAPFGERPEGRFSVAVGYDPLGQRTILAGGRDDRVTFGDSWELPLGPTPGPWSEIVAGGAPQGNLVLVGYDPSAHRFVAIERGRTPWFLPVFDKVWMRSSLADVPLAQSLGQFYDGRTNSFVVFDQDSLCRLRALPGETWSRILLPGPRPPNGYPQTMFHDARRRRVLVVGWQETSGLTHPEFWVLDVGASPQWTKIADVTPLGVRITPGIEDTRRDRLLFFGGMKRPQATPLGDLHVLDLESLAWSVPDASGTPPSARYRFAAGYDSLRDRAIVMGGVRDEVSPQPGIHYLEFSPTDANGTWIRNDAMGDPPPGEVYGQGAVDPGLDRFFVGLARWLFELEWVDGPPAVSVMCPSPVTASAGSIVPLPFVLTQADVVNRNYAWTVTAERDWPGFPLQGFLELSGTTLVPLQVGVPVPDSAAAGSGALEFVITDVANGANADSCRASIEVSAGGRALALSCAAAVTSIPGSTAQGRFRATITGSTATSLDWTATSARAWPVFPRSGSVAVAGGVATLDLDVAVPDTARVGTNVVVVTVRSASDAVADSCAWVITGPGATAPVPEFAVRVTPNPSSGAVGFALGLAHDTTVRVEIRGMATGRLAWSREFGHLAAGAYALDVVPAGTLAPGVYAVRFFLDGFTRHSKLVVLR